MLAPDLLASLEVLDSLNFSSTPDSVSVRVDINEQANCNGVEDLSITASISSGNTVLASQRARFANAIVMFESLDSGDYDCSVTVESSTGSLQEMSIPCSVVG